MSDRTQYPIHSAVFSGRLPALEQAVLENPTIVDAPDDEGNTLLHVAVRHIVRVRENDYKPDVNINLEMIRFLLDHGANLEAKNKEGMTALHQACVGRHELIIRALLDAGARLDAKGSQGETPLHIAALKDWSQTSITSLLCERGADVRAVDEHGRTPLHWAANQRPNNTIVSRVLYRDFGDIMEQSAAILLRYKADVNVRDDKGWTPLRYADAPRIEKIFDLIKAYGGTY